MCDAKRDRDLIQFDQFARYMILSEIVESLFDDQKLSIVDIGAGPSRLTECFLQERIGSLAVTDVEGFDRNDLTIVSPGQPLPFEDERFDVAIAMDVLEHVVPEQRSEFIREAIRVASLTIIATPIGSDATRRAESIYESAYWELHQKPLVFLSEHSAYGLPVSEDVIATGREFGANVFTTDCAPLDEWLTSNLIDLYLQTINDGYRSKSFMSRIINAQFPLRRAGDHHYRRFYVFTKNDTLAVKLAALPRAVEATANEWNGERAHLVTAKLFRDYVSSYNAPFVDEMRQAILDKDRYIEEFTKIMEAEVRPSLAAKDRHIEALTEIIQSRTRAESAEVKASLDKYLATARGHRAPKS